MSRATAPTARATMAGATLISRRCSHSAQRTSSASLQLRGKESGRSSQGSGRADQNLLPELVEHQRAGKGLIVRERGDDVGLVALGRAGEILQQLAGPARPHRRPMDVAGRIQAPTQFANLLFENCDRNAGRAFDRSQHLAFGQRLKPRLNDLAQHGAERRKIGRPRQATRGGFKIRCW